jgi:hypothetical protein
MHRRLVRYKKKIEDRCKILDMNSAPALPLPPPPHVKFGTEKRIMWHYVQYKKRDIYKTTDLLKVLLLSRSSIDHGFSKYISPIEDCKQTIPLQNAEC